jgi:hypothetical protein
VWVVLRRFSPNALKLVAANADDWHPYFIVKLRMILHLQRAVSLVMLAAADIIKSKALPFQFCARFPNAALILAQCANPSHGPSEWTD